MKAILALGLATLLLAACGFNRPTVERQSFVLAPLRATAAAPATGPSVKLGGVEVAPPFDGRGFVYRREGQRFESDFYNEFAAAPAELLGQATATWLRRSGLFAAVIESRLAGGADLRIDTAVSALYVDFTDEGPAAVLAVRWRITEEGRATREVSRDERVPLQARTPAGAAQAIQEALARALAGLEAALAGGR